MPAKPRSVSPFHGEKSRPYWNLHSRQNSETYASALEAPANAAEIEIEDFQDLMNLRLCFQPRPPCFNVGLYPLSATTAASEIWIRRQERPAASMGAAAQGEVDGRGERRVCVSLWAILDVHRPKDRVEREGMVGGLRAVNSECFSKLSSIYMLGLAAGHAWHMMCVLCPLNKPGQPQVHVHTQFRFNCTLNLKCSQS